MRATREQLVLLNSNMSKLSERVETCENRIDSLCARMNEQERLIDEKSDSSLLSVIEQLKAGINERDQELLMNDIQFSCVPEQKGENPLHIVISLANKLGVSLSETDVVSCERLGRSPESVIEVSPTIRPRLIVVRLARRALRDQLLQAARVRRGATTEGVGVPGPSRRFYVNERLTKIKIDSCSGRPVKMLSVPTGGLFGPKMAEYMCGNGRMEIPHVIEFEPLLT
ncbi:unnamed protein product, partial [Iphiclides podalirius]